jgi:alcohol dehydrogenase YqhD (iron-dependent ADH family)
VRANLMWAATQALNGLIGAGVPQDWATHMLGHEITALHGLDHAQTLAVVLPAMLDLRREAKRDKLLQYASRVWGLHDGSETSASTRPSPAPAPSSNRWASRPGCATTDRRRGRAAPWRSSRRTA